DNGLAKIVGQSGFVDAAGNSGVTIVRVSVFCLGPFSHADLEFGVGAGDSIGMEYLSRFIVVLDKANRRINLKRGTGYGDSKPYRTSGLLLLLKGDNILVGAVFPGSRGDKAGFAKDDVLISVAGIDRSEQTLTTVRKVLRTATASLDVTVKRGDQVIV